MNTPPHPPQLFKVKESSQQSAKELSNESLPRAYESGKLSARAPTKAARRIRGDIACAECRRLKIRCDKNIPCATCVKRGCEALCPNGTIPPGEGSRFVIAATDHLRNQITRLEARMRSLEDALAIMHTSESDRPHPLLVPTNNQDEEVESILKPVPEEQTEPFLGTLFLDPLGGSRFFGASGGSESLLQTSKSVVLQDLDVSYLPPDIKQCYQSFPFTPPNVIAAPIQETIESFLPGMERAIALCDNFLEQLSWMFHIVSRQLCVNELIPTIYKQNDKPYGPHDLALLLIVLGIGCLVDLKLRPFNLEAQHYYQLARATLALQPVLAERSVVTIKVLHLMSIYNGMSGKESNLEQSYVFLDLAGQVALQIGFHVDPVIWGLKGREAYDRRVYFWNLMSAVLWQSLVTGRPPSLLTSYVDCRIPTEEEEDLFQQGEVPLGFGIWGFKASQLCLMPVVRAVLTAKPPSYDVIIELDRKIRDLSVPRTDMDTLQSHAERTAISMRTFVRSHYQELMLLFLHRAYFTQAMSEYPLNPLQSPYRQSVTAAYSSACIVLQDTRSQFSRKPILCARVWRIWSFTFSAAVVVGTVAIRGAHLDLKPPPLQEFEAICKVFNEAAKTSNRAERALPILKVMLQKANQAHEHYRGRGRLPMPLEADGLSFFGGRARVVIPDDTSTPSITPPPPPPLPPQRRQQQQQYQPPQQSYTTSRLPEQPYQLPFPNVDNISHQRNNDSNGQYQTIAQLSGGWDGLFHEVPGPSYGLPTQGGGVYAGGPNQGQPMGDGAMLDDRWASFMNYGFIG